MTFDRNANARELYPVMKKYVAEGPAGFVLQNLARRLQELLVPPSDELNKILEFSDYYANRGPAEPIRDANDIEVCGFVKRALRLYEATDYEHFSAVEDLIRVARRLVEATRWPFDREERDRINAALAKIDGKTQEVSE